MNVNTAANAVNTANVTNGANVAKYIVPGISEKATHTYKGEKVFTLNDIDKLFSFYSGKAKGIYHRYKSMFVEGKDYFQIVYPETKHMGFNGSRCNLFTASGVNKIISRAFRRACAEKAVSVEESVEDKPGEIKAETPKPKTIKFHKIGFYFEKTFRGHKVVSMDDIVAFTGISKGTARTFFYRDCKEGEDYEFLKGLPLDDYLEENPKCTKCARLIVAYQSGYEKLCKHYGVIDAISYFDSSDTEFCNGLDTTVAEAIRSIRRNYKIEAYPLTSPYSYLLPKQDRERDVFVKVAGNVCFIFYNEEKSNVLKDKFLVELVRGLMAKEA